MKCAMDVGDSIAAMVLNAHECRAENTVHFAMALAVWALSSSEVNFVSNNDADHLQECLPSNHCLQRRSIYLTSSCTSFCFSFASRCMAVAAEVAASIVARVARMLSAAATAAVAGSTRGGACCSAAGADHGCAETPLCGCMADGPGALLPGGLGSSGGALPLVPTQLNILSSSRWN